MYHLRASRLGKFLRAWRNARGITQQEVADGIEVNRSTISKLENGYIKNFSDPDYWKERLEILVSAFGNPRLDAKPPFRGVNLREWRIASGLSQRQAGKLFGTTRSNINHFERQPFRILPRKIGKILNKYHYIKRGVLSF